MAHTVPAGTYRHSTTHTGTSTATRVRRLCSAYGCQYDAGTCPSHGRVAKQKTYDVFRGSPASRGYDSHWTHHRNRFIAELTARNIPAVCGARLPGALETADSECSAKGYLTPGRTADHIIPVTGPDDPTFWLMEALQFLCESCDARKRQRESRGASGGRGEPKC